MFIRHLSVRWSIQEKVCRFDRFDHYSQSVCKRVSPGWSLPEFESFVDFEGQQLCSPLNYKPLEISKTALKVCQKMKRLVSF